MLKEVVEKIKQWETHLLSLSGFSSNTIKAYSRDMKNLVSFIQQYIGSPPTIHYISSIDLTTLRSWLAYRRKNNVSSVSSNRAIASVRSFYRFLQHEGYNISNAILQIEFIKTSVSQAKPLSIESVLKCIEYNKKTDWITIRDRALIILLYTTGLRISEALSITKKHLLQESRITILGKGNKERIIPLLSIARQEIDKYLNCLPHKISDTYPIFVGERGKKLHHSVFAKKLQFIRDATGVLTKLTPHKLRHSFASHLLKNGANLRQIQELLGHKNLSSTQRYTAIDIDKLRQIHQLHPLNKN